MPRKAQFAARLIFRMTRIEAEALKFVGGERGASDTIRKMLWYYLKNAGDFEVAAFCKHVQTHLAPKLGPEGRARLLRDLDALAQAMNQNAPSPASAPLLTENDLTGWLSHRA